MLATLGLNGVPMVIGQYRERGILRRLGVTPVRPLTLLVAKMTVWAASAMLVGGDGHRGGADRLPRAGAGRAGLVRPVGRAGHRLAVRARHARGGRGADRQERGGLGWLLFFPNMFLAGVYFPSEEMSSTMRQIGNFTPLGSALHAVRDSWMGLDPRPEYLGIMAAYAVIAGAVAARFFRWEQA